MLIVLTVLAFFAFYALGSVLLAWPTMFLWNNLMPAIFHLPMITFWQAAGICLLARFIFGLELLTPPSSEDLYGDDK